MPEGKAAPILLYCRTGRMSADAATAPVDAGYTNVVYLEGGMDAWVAAGHRLEYAALVKSDAGRTSARMKTDGRTVPSEMRRSR